MTPLSYAENYGASMLNYVRMNFRINVFFFSGHHGDPVSLSQCHDYLEEEIYLDKTISIFY